MSHTLVSSPNGSSIHVLGKSFGARPQVSRGRCLITTFRWTGAAVDSRARFGWAGDRLFVRLRARSTAAENIWERSRARVRRDSDGGERAGPVVDAWARVLPTEGEIVAARVVAANQPTLRRFLLRLMRRARLDGVYVEILPPRQGTIST